MRRWTRLGAAAILLSVAGCASMPGQASYKPTMPVLTIEQYESCVVKESESQRDMHTTCVRLLAQEYGEIVTEFKAMCLALGHGAEYCGTSGVRMEPSLVMPTAHSGCLPVELRLE